MKIFKKQFSNYLSKERLNSIDKIPSATYRVFSSNSDVKKYQPKVFMQKEILYYSAFFSKTK